jgi:thiol:disulfide interchange protein
MLRSSEVIRGSKKYQLPSRETVLYGILTLVIALGVLQITALLGLTMFRQLEVNANIRNEQVRVTQLQNQVADLKTRFQEAKNDPVYLEFTARNLGFIKKGERVIIPKREPNLVLTPKPK